MHAKNQRPYLDLRRTVNTSERNNTGFRWHAFATLYHSAAVHFNNTKANELVQDFSSVRGAIHTGDRSLHTGQMRRYKCLDRQATERGAGKDLRDALEICRFNDNTVPSKLFNLGNMLVMRCQQSQVLLDSFGNFQFEGSFARWNKGNRNCAQTL